MFRLTLNTHIPPLKYLLALRLKCHLTVRVAFISLRLSFTTPRNTSISTHLIACRHCHGKFEIFEVCGTSFGGFAKLWPRTGFGYRLASSLMFDGSGIIYMTKRLNKLQKVEIV